MTREGRLSGKTALVTAAGQGIGKETVELFAREGATVWAADINTNALAAVVGCRTIVLDMCDQAAVAHAIAEAGPLDILFNCAGMVANGTVLECDWVDWNRSFDLNVHAMFHAIRAALPAMIESGGGSIINMSSVASSITGVPNRCAYGATKAAVIGLTRSVAADFVKQNIRCNAICPGTVETPSLLDRLRATDDFDEAWAAFTARQPMGRLGRPSEIAALALYLASDESAFTTGQELIIDGGWTI